MTKTFFNPQETCWVGQKVRAGFSITEIQCFSRSFRKDRRKEDGAGMNFSQQTHRPSSLVPFCPPASFLSSAILAPPHPQVLQLPPSTKLYLLLRDSRFSTRGHRALKAVFPSLRWIRPWLQPPPSSARSPSPSSPRLDFST